MNVRRWTGFTYLLLSSSLATAGSMGPTDPGFQPIISLFGGVANLKVNHSQTHVGTDDDLFVYRSQRSNKTKGYIGGFVGLEHTLPYPNLSLQAGVEYDYYDKINVKGLHTVGIEPETSTLYTYKHRFQSQQVLAVAKLLTTFNQIYHPYVAVGLGASFNKMNRFNAFTQEVGSINLAPIFEDNTHTSFSYNVGLGVDASVSEHLRLGVGYRFSDLGKARSGDGRVIFNNYSYPTQFTLNVPHIYSNQFIAQISYIV